MEENKEIELYLASKELDSNYSSEYWIGLTNQVIRGAFVWTSTGQVANFTNWLNGEPRPENDDDMYCGVLTRQIYDRQWNAYSCQNSTALALCQIGITTLFK